MKIPKYMGDPNWIGYFNFLLSSYEHMNKVEFQKKANPLIFLSLSQITTVGIWLLDMSSNQMAKVVR